jgi:aspartate/methionine/tyrosine aminotransferase
MSFKLEDVSPQVRETEYAVRGPIVTRAAELERAGREVIYCNIGNPQSLGQRPLTWVRQVLALCEYPELIERVPAGTFPVDVVELARYILQQSRHGLGIYTEAKGFRFVREAVAEFIRTRDGIAADPEAIFLTDGASKAVQSVLRMLIGGRQDGILIPFPQYPLYSATIALYEGTPIPYTLDEASDWGFSTAMLEEAHAGAVARGIRPRAVVVINPGNPTGAVLDEQNVEAVLRFASAKGLAVLADEVYQENVYRPGARFVSFASVATRLGLGDVPLFSFHSASKGFLGECGHRGGYVECRNVDAGVQGELTKLQSVALCANSAGQIVTFLMVRPPRDGEPSHELYRRERSAVLEALARKAALLERGLDAIPGISCRPVAGAMYAFPSLTLPPGVTDTAYCMALLEETGVCVVDGCGFGQAEGTHHLRTTILPPVEQLEEVVRRLARFHEKFTRQAAEGR